MSFIEPRLMEIIQSNRFLLIDSDEEKIQIELSGESGISTCVILRFIVSLNSCY